ncbi:hypothetical protein N7456_010802 [Penicillium angulare]|uniref:Ig-like domain-containing protein n=1 Tax=Penicillium angulare TaxID=116970 RepID=A0A9W9ESK6_9EURO|nr:hypothetical protein N7456_010802 [Penicillium angulare]
MATRRPGNRNVQKILHEVPPPLRIGDFKTTSSAIHDIDFLGQFREWTTFGRAAQTYLAQIEWEGRDMTLLDRVDGELYSLKKEHVVVGNETDLQGRFIQCIGHCVGALFRAQQIDLQFASAQSAQRQYSLTPDSIMMDDGATRKVVGELKVPWVERHSLEEAPKHEDRFRRVFGQIAQYMGDLNLKYGFMSTYEETVFLKLESSGGPNSETILYHSPVILRDSRSSNTPGSESVTIRQAFFYLGCLANSGHRHAVIPRPGTTWVKVGKT